MNFHYLWQGFETLCWNNSVFESLCFLLVHSERTSSCDTGHTDSRRSFSDPQGGVTMAEVSP